jgi:hypothetical protein
LFFSHLYVIMMDISWLCSSKNAFVRQPRTTMLREAATEAFFAFRTYAIIVATTGG